MSKLTDRFGEACGRAIFFIAAASLVGMIDFGMLMQVCGDPVGLHSGHFPCLTSLTVAGLGLNHLCRKNPPDA